ncbi:MAG: hypothetical protein R3F44_11365 [Candidatus Competibacteraceae bacterium]
MFRKAIGMLFVFTSGCYGIGLRGWAWHAGKGKMMVEKAVAYLNEHGKDKALMEFNKPNGMFKGDLYVFAYDMNGAVGHPNPKLIGVNLLDKPDSTGKLFRKEINELKQNQRIGMGGLHLSKPRKQAGRAKDDLHPEGE